MRAKRKERKMKIKIAPLLFTDRFAISASERRFSLGSNQLGNDSNPLVLNPDEISEVEVTVVTEVLKRKSRQERNLT